MKKRALENIENRVIFDTQKSEIWEIRSPGGKLVIVSFADGHKALISTLSSFRFYNGQTASARLSKIF